MEEIKAALDEQQRRGLQEYIFDLEEIKEQAEELTLAYEKLKSSQDLLLAVLGCTVHGLCLMKQRRLVWGNQALMEIFGWDAEELVGKTLEFLCPNPSDYAHVFGTDNARTSGDLLIEPYEFIHKSGRRVSCFISKRALDEKEPARGMVFSITDVTDRIRSQEALQQAYDELQQRSGELVRTNEQLNREIDERKRAEQQLHAYREQLEELVAARTSQLRSTNAQLRQEVLDRSRAEEELKKANDYLESIFQDSPDAIVIVDEDGRLVKWSNMATVLYGAGIEKLKGRKVFELYADSAERDRMLTQLRRDGFISKYEINVKRETGGSFPVELSISRLRDNQGRIIGSVAISRDLSHIKKMVETLTSTNEQLTREIAARKEMEECLKESQQRLADIIDFLPDATLVIDAQGRAIAWNRAMEAMTGIPAGEMLGKGNYEYALPFYGERRPILIDLVLKPQREIEEKYLYVTKEDRILAGETYSSTFRQGHTYLSGKASVLRDSKGCVVGAIESIRDISDRRALEARLRQAQKMEAMGTLAGGIAHDFNNILAAIIGYTEMTKSQLQHPVLSGYLDRVLKSSNRAKNLVRQIVTFSRGVEQEKIPVEVKSLVKEAISLLRATLPTTIEIRQEISDEVSPVLADPTQIHQILMNLCTNAAYAMREHGGVLDIRLKDEWVTPGRKPCDQDLPVGHYVKLEVGDTGTGIAPEVIHRIFDPFFTTKKQGEGTGLGLSMVYGVVKAYGGAVCVQSPAGGGAVFSVYLPAISQDTAPATEPPEVIPGGGRERILFVDDEEILMEMGRDILGELGYEVTSTGDSVRALEIFRSEVDSFDLVITDMTMPRMTGTDLAKQILQLRPQIPIILCTGHSDLITEEEAKRLGIREYLMKPYHIRGIAEMIRRVLEPKSQT